MAGAVAGATAESVVIPAGLPDALGILNLPKPWADAFGDADPTGCITFAWAHNGDHCGNSWIELHPGGVLESKWGRGEWFSAAGDPERLDICFGNIRHVSRIAGFLESEAAEGGGCVPTFVVESRISRKTGRPSGAEARSRGWRVPERPGRRSIAPACPAAAPAAEGALAEGGLAEAQIAGEVQAEPGPRRRYSTKAPVAATPRSDPATPRSFVATPKSVAVTPTSRPGARAKRLQSQPPLGSKPPPPKREKVPEPRSHDFWPLFSLLDECNAEPSLCRKMLRAAAPFSLRTPKEKRHRHQEMVISMMSEVFEAEREARSRSVQATREQLLEADAVRSRVAAQLTSAQAIAAVKQQERDALQEELDAHHRSEVEATTALSEVAARETRLPEEIAAARATEEDVANTIASLWKPLKEGFPGADQKHKNRIVKQLKDLFETIGADEAFLRTFTQMMKKQSAQRTPMAEKTMAFGEKMLLEHQRKQADHVRELVKATSSFRGSIEAARGAVASTEEQRSAVAARLGASQADYQKALEACNSVQAQLSALDEEREGVEKQATAAQLRLQAFGEQFAKFEALKSYSKNLPDIAPPQGSAASAAAVDARAMCPGEFLSPWPSPSANPSMSEELHQLVPSDGHATMDGRRPPVRAPAASPLLYDARVDVD